VSGAGTVIATPFVAGQIGFHFASPSQGDAVSHLWLLISLGNILQHARHETAGFSRPIAMIFI
jgi:hypothetical protein